jgi:hypothetical protein
MKNYDSQRELNKFYGIPQSTAGEILQFMRKRVLIIYTISFFSDYQFLAFIFTTF